MITQAQFDRVARAFAILHRAEPQAARELQQATFFAALPAGRDIFVDGDRPDALALVTSGTVRGYMIGQSGREITLYRFGLGESCILTANAILNQQPFPALATVEQPIETVMVPADAFRHWIRRYDVWREFFFDLLSQRFVSVLGLVEEVVFRRMDARVASLLLERGRTCNPIAVTHQEIAAELGSSREVISRILESFAGAGAIHSTRGAIDILDFGTLKSLSAA